MQQLLGRCSCISFLECPSVFTEALLQSSARLSNIHLGAFEQGIWYTTAVRWSTGTGSLEWTSWRLRVLCGRKATLMSSPHTTPLLTTLTTQNTSTMHSQRMCTFRSSQLTPSVPTERGFCICCMQRWVCVCMYNCALTVCVHCVCSCVYS